MRIRCYDVIPLPLLYSLFSSCLLLSLFLVVLSSVFTFPLHFHLVTTKCKFVQRLDGVLVFMQHFHTSRACFIVYNIYFGFHSLFIFHIMFTLFKWFLFKRFQTFHFFVVFVVVLHHIRLVYLYLDRLFLYKLTFTIISVDFFLCFIFD